MDVVAGKTAMAPLYKGEVLLEARFNSVQRQTLQVPEGLCAVSVPSKSVTAVGGSLAPGTIVDVYATSGLGTDLVASRVEVLSTSALAADGKESGSPDVTWVTLAVKPGLVEEPYRGVSESGTLLRASKRRCARCGNGETRCGKT